MGTIVKSESLMTRINNVRSIVGSRIAESDICEALSQSNNNACEAICLILNSPSFFQNSHLTAQKTLTSTGGSRISTLQINPPKNLEEGEKGKFSEGLAVVKQEEPLYVVENVEAKGDLGGEKEGRVLGDCETGLGFRVAEKVKEECDLGFPSGGENQSSSVGRRKLLQDSEKKVEEKQDMDMGAGVTEFVKVKEVGFVNNEVSRDERNVLSGVRSSGLKQDCVNLHSPVKREENQDMDLDMSVGLGCVKVKEECPVDFMEVETFEDVKVKGESNVENLVKKEDGKKNEHGSVIGVKDKVNEALNVRPLSARKLSDEDCRIFQRRCSNNGKPKSERVEDKSLSSVVIEDGDFPEDPDWLLVGRTVITGLSTTKGRKLVNNEIVHFAFPNASGRSKSSTHFMSAKAANAASSIVRFSTKRSGEIGRLPMEWAKCLVPLVNSSKVKVLGRCVAAPVSLLLMQEIMLYVSFYIHHSVFTNGDNSSWKLEPTNIDSTIYPLLNLFKLLNVNPSQKAEFTPEELASRKRSLKLDDESDGNLSVLPMAKRRNGCQIQDHDKTEQAISEASLNKLVGAVDMYNLEEMEPPETLACDLRPYQKQALYWMSELESGANAEETAKTLHPCWAAYSVCDERAPAIYVNVFSGEATTQFPTATQMARGGILADAMGLGKTVMTIALILARRGRGINEDQQVDQQEFEVRSQRSKNRQWATEGLRKLKGGTLIVCPMALLSQWKDELEAHSKPDRISVFVHYGGDRSNDARVIAEPDVVLTTYGVLTSAYKSDSVNSIFHRIEWHRVVLDEAHTIKSWKTQAAQAAFALSSYCRWCLTGTPLQNNLEDLYSLLCFLHVEPWCNWAWWNKLIQKPYENGDNRGLKLVRAILRPLMLRRTKESKDKEGRPILVLPPTDIQVIECEQSEAEYDFYSALFKRSKVQFDQFVAQGKVLHNYANILELLLRLRQCCNHPFLVMSRGDTEKYADLSKLANRFLQNNPNTTTQTCPSKAYVEEVVEGIKNGENTECPICLESADDPVLTPCAHRMCRECLLSSWHSPAAGFCPICRQVVRKTELITCPTGTRFRVDVEKNWKESSKILSLLDCLENIRKSGSGEKSIVFSQWTSFLDLLEIPLTKRGFEFLRFDGKLAQKKREKVLHEFADTRNKTVLLMSLKTGGVGLNLTAASNVFLMDPWWNPAVEEQAIMRIHRIGQKRTVHVRRFIVKNTVEERLQQVQARKQRMIAGALTDEEVRSTRLEELKMLFR
ncbi:DNA repair helicase rad5 [Striga asiatica]|uniref:DNA repair helicase rad5 n=1 Tax=Striga asiatica TaxID=4170 RepID=A0A5A7NYD2_STRAF|nr:DNA repair helicase rad5 [Striga asiatica]